MKWLAVIIGLSPIGVNAQTLEPCTERDQFLEFIGGKYDEGRIGIGMTSRDHVCELFANDETGTWTFACTDGAITCIYFAGDLFNVGDMTRPSQRGEAL